MKTIQHELNTTFIFSTHDTRIIGEVEIIYTLEDGRQHLSSFLLVVGLVPNFDKLRRSLSFNKTLNGILCSFVGILLMTTVRFANVPWEIARTLLASATFVALLLQVESICVVVIGTAVSVFVL